MREQMNVVLKLARGKSSTFYFFIWFNILSLYIDLWLLVLPISFCDKVFWLGQKQGKSCEVSISLITDHCKFHSALPWPQIDFRTFTLLLATDVKVSMTFGSLSREHATLYWDLNFSLRIRRLSGTNRNLCFFKISIFFESLWPFQNKIKW